jgi:hypothetical protein
MQIQAVQAIGQTLAAMQQVQQQPPPPQPPVQVQMPQVPRDKRAEFMRVHPPVFAHSADPMDAEDWLCTMERELHTAQCNNREKVLYGPRQLRGAAQSWWESYLATHANPEAITWEEFRDNFRRYHVPEGLMIVRKEEFLALKQGPLSISEYRDKFLQLSCYAPEDVNTDAKRQYRFLRGLVDPLHSQLMNHTFPTFHHLIDRAIMTERKRREMEDRKRKIGGPQVGSSSRPCYLGNPPQPFKQVTSTSISVRTSHSSTRGSFLINSSTIRTTNKEEINTSVRATRQPVFLPQQPTRAIKQRQLKEEVVHVSTVVNTAIGRIIAQRKQLSSSQLPMPQSGRMQCSQEATTVGNLVPSMER